MILQKAHLHPIIMEQNHKHHRRRRLKVITDLTMNYNLNCSSHNNKIIEQNISPISPPVKRTSQSQVRILSLLSPLILLLLSALTVIERINAQHNYLISGHSLENLRVPENFEVGAVVHQLKAVDRINEGRKFSYHMTGDTFSVDEQTGEVRLVKPLDRERQSNLTVIVSVIDNSDTRNIDTPVESRQRRIIIEDIDDSWPVFGIHKYSLLTSSPQSQYQVDVSELAALRSIVLAEVQVTDADEGSNADVVVECRPKQSTNSACDVFSIESRKLYPGKYSVTVRTKALLDYEHVQSYKLSLVARGTRSSPLKGAPLETEAIVKINILNVQDEGPVFVNAPYSLSMQEGLKNNTRLLNVLVQDGDAAPQRELSMIVVPGPYSKYFQVSREPDVSQLWYLVTNNTIDREDALISDAGNMFTISLLAAELNEQGLPVASEVELVNALREQNYSKGTLRRVDVTVVVLDLPDSRPIFVQASTNKPLKEDVIVVNISESILTGSSIPNLDLAVYDLDQGINSRFNLALEDAGSGPQASNVFALESTVIYGKAEIVLNVLNSSLLDYEEPSLRTYRFNLVASKAIVSPLYQSLEVVVNVMDANDNSPEFEKNQYVVNVLEGSLPDTLIATIKATDKDSGANGKLEYLLRGTGASKFGLVKSEGKIVVKNCGVPQCIDYEAQPSFSLTYEARDGGGRTKNVSVIINVIDINDHTPKFSEPVYKRDLISDNISSKQNYISPQLIVKARDGDGPTQGKNNITYRIKSTNLTGLDVDPNSGLVYFSQPLDLDQTISTINAANNARAGDKKITFEAEVVAEDNGSPMQSSVARILLVVKGNRDGAPQFKQDSYSAYVRENQPVNKPFFQVQAIDPDEKDSQLRYSLGYDLNDLVNINTTSGELSFKTKVDYDEFKEVPYNITVYATDNSKPYPLRASAVVSIHIQDVNDKMPKFDEKEYKATLIQGRTKAGDLVLRVNALDLDRNALLEYSIIQDQLFVHDRNGERFTLPEIANSTTGYLAQMNKQDRGQLVTGLKKLFYVNKKTGAIEMRHEPDYSFAASITILVRVQDLNQEVFTSTGELQEDFVACSFFLQSHIDKSPIFAPPWSIDRRDYNISMLEELSNGTTIFSLLAKDPSTNKRIETFEKVFESDPKDYFRVDRSGVVHINRRIDYEELPAGQRMSLSVKAFTDDVYFSVANINIQVIDLNDNAPQFKNQNYSVAISEATTYPTEILTVSAEDKDSNEFGQVYYSLSSYSNDLFTIDARKGVISVKKGAKLDRDTEATHSLFVAASDCNETIRQLPTTLEQQYSRAESSGCKKSSVPVTIVLLDENDNEPVFVNVNKRGEIEAIASETISVGSIITQAIAHDVDEDVNGQVGYEIVRSDEPISRLIKIDQEGYIIVAGSVAGMGRPAPYRLTIRAFDYGNSSNSRSSYATLLLTINDVVSNDGVPRFIKPRQDEVIYLRENSGPNTFVYQVQAIDPDAESRLMYKFERLSDHFEIDPFNGRITTQKGPNFFLDRELVPNFTLIIVATDLGTPPKEAHQVLTIRLTDINDNEPYFERQPDDPALVLYVEEEVPKDTLIGTIHAVDKDVAQNALIGYEIVEGNSDDMFRLDYKFEDEQNTTEATGNNKCRIYSTARLDREKKDSYTLTIKASSMSRFRNPHQSKFKDPLAGRNPFNQYNASDLTKLRVTIQLLDINDNRPVFEQQNAKSVVDSSAEVYSQLMAFKASDADSSDSEIQYSLLDVLYYSDSKFKSNVDLLNENAFLYNAAASQPIQPASMKNVFDIDSRTGILRNSVSLRPYIDGYFEVFVKADSGLYNHQLNSQTEEPLSYNSLTNNKKLTDSISGKCQNNSVAERPLNGSANGNTFDDIQNCYVTVAKAVIFVTHQRETFRFVFNKTKLNDRLDEFKKLVQNALEEIMFDPSQPQASLDSRGGLTDVGSAPRAEKIFLNTFNTDFYEREDGSLDFSTLTSCSQLVKFDDRSADFGSSDLSSRSYTSNTIVPNQVVNYEEVLNLLKTLNATQVRNQKTPLFSQYGLINIERCLPGKTMYRMSLSERVSVYFAITIAVVGALLAFIVSNMRKSYEKHLKLLQRSKYQYMSPYRPAHHMSLGTLPGSNFIAPPYGTHMDTFEGAGYDTWQL